MQCGIGHGETVGGKIAREAPECFLVALVERRGVGDQDRLVKLRSTCEKSGNEGDAGASPLVPEQVGDARSFVVLILRQI